MIHRAGVPKISYASCLVMAGGTKDVQPKPAPKSNQSDSGQVRLLKPAITHTQPTVPLNPLKGGWASVCPASLLADARLL